MNFRLHWNVAICYNPHSKKPQYSADDVMSFFWEINHTEQQRDILQGVIGELIIELSKIAAYPGPAVSTKRDIAKYAIEYAQKYATNSDQKDEK